MISLGDEHCIAGGAVARWILRILDEKFSFDSERSGGEPARELISEWTAGVFFKGRSRPPFSILLHLNRQCRSGSRSPLGAPISQESVLFTFQSVLDRSRCVWTGSVSEI